MRRRLLITLLLTAPVLVPAACNGEPAPDASSDLVDFGDEAIEIGLLVDGAVDGTVVNDVAFLGTGPKVPVGPYDGPGSGILAFASDRAVCERSAAWTEASDTLAMTLDPAIVLPITVWVLEEPVEERTAYMEECLLKTIELFRQERFGVTFAQPFDIRPAADNPAAASLLDVRCSDREDLVAKIGGVDEHADGYKPDRILVFLVHSVDGRTDNGNACGTISTHFCMLGHDAPYHLLAHELGHTLALSHVNHPEALGTDEDPTGTMPGFTSQNLMHGLSDARSFITEGQTYRAHFMEKSSLNTLGLRPDRRTGAAISGGTTAQDPDLTTRIWPDEAPSPEAAPVAGGSPASPAELWLALGCTNAERGSDTLTFLAGRLRGSHNASLALLREAYQKGPDAQRRTRLRATATREFEARHRLLSGPALTLHPAMRARLLAVPRDKYVDDAEARLVRGYRAAAIAGLGALGSTQARASLQGFLADLGPGDPGLRRLIERALH